MPVDSLELLARSSVEGVLRGPDAHADVVNVNQPDFFRALDGIVDRRRSTRGRPTCAG